MTVIDLHKRISLEKFEVWQQPDARWAARVALAWRPGGKASVGTAEGDGSPQGQVRCAAEATARALELSVDGTMAITVLAVKVIDGSDTVLTVVSLTSRVDALAEHRPTMPRSYTRGQLHKLPMFKFWGSAPILSSSRSEKLG